MNRVVVITGGGTGVGAACARLLAAQGDRVFIIGRRPEPLAALAQRSARRRWWAMPPAASWNHALLPAILREAGRIDCLIGSAGGMGFKRVTEMTDAQWQGAMDSNLNSAFASARACLPELIKSGGNLLFVASIASLAAGPEVCGYVTAKHALIGLMRSIARDYGPLGVRANAVCPGWVTTPMADEEMQLLMDAHQISLEQAYQMVCRDVPLRRPASAEEIARVCRFLCSSEASIITGAALVADGGSTIVDVPTLAFTSL